MKNVLKFGFLLLLFVSLVGCKSYVNPISGNTSLGFLAGQGKVNVVFTYDELSVNEYPEEKDYIAESMRKRNEDEPGTGAEWKGKWFDQRNEVFEPEFLEGLNDKNRKGIHFSRDNDAAEYTLLLEVNHIETGWHAAVMNKDAEVDITAKFIKTSSLKNPAQDPNALFTINDVPSRTQSTSVGGALAFTYDFAVSQRVGNAFELAGEELGKYIRELEF